MSEFNLFFGLGMEHILDIAGYDHILFVVALCVVYSAMEWKRVLILVTAFTVGHSITLALATLKVVTVPADIIEFLIPVTIFITAVVNISRRNEVANPQKTRINYFFALFFGLIHGLGFSNYLQSLLGKNASIVGELFAFNVGLEVGQIIIVGIFMLLGFIAVNKLKMEKRDWITIVSSAVMGISLVLMLETKFW